MVWEDKANVVNTVYTNTNDVPLYVQFAVYSPSGDENNLVDFKIDGVVVGAVGSVGPSNWNNPLHIVPSGSTYEVVSEQLATVDKWREAKMPVAVGTGGKTVAFKATISTNQLSTSDSQNEKVNLDTTSIDTDNALVDGKFKPSVAGYYQVSGATRSAEDGIINITAHIYKNSQLYCRGSHIHHSPNDGGSDLSVVSDVVYLNGKEDYIELYAQLKMGSKNIRNGLENTFLSAVLVSGGSASGDSIWTEEDGKAVYDGVVKSTSHFNTNGDGTAGGIHFKDGDVLISRIDNDMVLKADGADRMKLTANGVTTYQDIKVNEIGVGRGSGNHINSTTVGNWSLQKATGDQNTAVGYGTLTATTTGTRNTALGSQSLTKNLTGNYNTGIGDSSIGSLETGGANTAVGFQAGFNLVSGSNNLILGNQAQPSSPNVSNEVTIGNDNVVDTRLKGRVLLNDNWNGGSDNKNGLGIATSTSSATAYAMYVRNSGGTEIFTLRCDGSTRASKLYLGDDKVDLRAELNLKDKLIEKLSARLDELEKRVK
jgi:hypothetical protein